MAKVSGIRKKLIGVRVHPFVFATLGAGISPPVWTLRSPIHIHKRCMPCLYIVPTAVSIITSHIAALLQE
jgi:hypothetical protein